MTIKNIFLNLISKYKKADFFLLTFASAFAASIPPFKWTAQSES